MSCCSAVRDKDITTAIYHTLSTLASGRLVNDDYVDFGQSIIGLVLSERLK